MKYVWLTITTENYVCEEDEECLMIKLKCVSNDNCMDTVVE